MQRHKQIIQLSDHVKNKLKQHQYPSSSFINSSDEFIEVNSIDDDDDSSVFTAAENATHQRGDTYTTHKVKQSFFTDRKSIQNPFVSVLQEKYKKQQQCQECIRRDRIIRYHQQDLLRLSNENKELTNQLHSSVLLNHQYENEIKNLKYHLTKVNSHLYEYQINFDHLKQKIVSDKKTVPKLGEEQDGTTDHLKRLRYEIQMYNRIVAAKQHEEEKNQQKQIDFLF